MSKEHQKSASQKISTLGGFIAGGLAACGAVTFTNPIELVKTRMQLQGELTHLTGGEKIYKNPIQALFKIYSKEGLAGIQKGLTCAYIYQIGLNGCRLGLYEPSRNILNSVFYPTQDPHAVQSVPVNVAAGALSGIAGAIVGSPLFLIKTRMQSYSVGSIAVGEQTHYKNFIDGFATILKTEGFKGLFRGVDAAIIRTGMGSSVQLPIYNYVKNFLKNNDLINEGAGLHLISSTVAGLGVGVVMNPGDVVLTRMYNQKGDLYKGPVDCFIKTIKYEGVFALYKGFGAQLLRIAPHTILTLTFMEQTMKFMQLVETKIKFE